MSRCRSPIVGYQSSPGAVLTFNSTVGERHDFKQVTVPCGQCVSCRLARSRMWAVRCLHESSMHGDRNCFVTLTYSDEFLPPWPHSLRYRDFQLFMKRLRRTGRRARFYMCGEYGEDRGRPHYHAMLFNVWFDDCRYWRMSPAGFKLYRSKELESLWPFGACEIGLVSFQSAAYVARYVLKKVTGNLADVHYRCVNPDTGEVAMRVPEFSRMSLKPGIGASWYKKFRSDVYGDGMVVVNGVKTMPPRYYDKLFALDDAFGAAELQEKRELAAVSAGDNSWERRVVKGKVEDAKLAFLKRTI